MSWLDRQLSAKEFLAQIDPSVHEAIKATLRHCKSTAAVMFENVAFDSSQFGRRSVLGVGPDNTYKTIGECNGKWLNDLPSQRQYPQNWCLASDILNAQ